jgi:hypothetical protein
MSICVAFNLSDGVVIAVDSATTMTDASGAISKVFIDADKLFQLGNLRIGIATYGVAALEGRTIGSFIREFTLVPSNSDIASLSMAEIVERLRAFIFQHYKDFAEKLYGMTFDQIPESQKGALGLVVGGFSSGAFQSELWEIVIPANESENSARCVCQAGAIGVAWFASALPINRYLKGFDWQMVSKLEAFFKGLLGRDLTQDELQQAITILGEAEFHIRTDGMPIQSGIDCARFLVEFVLGHYRFAETHPIVGGKAKIGVVAYGHSAFRILE